MLPETIRFGTSGVRGVTGKEITIELARHIGWLYGRWKRLTYGAVPPNLTVAHDQRRGASALAEAAARGLFAGGAGEVDLLGCVPTGVMCSHTAVGDYQGGVLVTGSHMPPNRIGVILIEYDGRYCEPAVNDEMARRYRLRRNEEIPTSRRDPRSLAYGQVIDGYQRGLEQALGQVGDAIRGRGFKILVDAGNGTAGPLASHILTKSFGCQVIPLNERPQEIPDRPSEVRASTCDEAIRLVGEMRCDLGVAYDGDADRVLFITPEDGAVNEDVAGALFARHHLQPGQVCVTPVNSSPLINRICREDGIHLRSCRIGQPDTGRAVVEYDASFFYEAAAKYGWSMLKMGDQPVLWYDSLLATLQMLGLMATTGKTAHELVSALPRFYRQDVGIEHPGSPEKKQAVVAWAANFLRDQLGSKILTENTLDGFRFDLAGDFMVMTRASGTEPKVRGYADGPDLARVQELAALGERALREAIAATA